MDLSYCGHDLTEQRPRFRSLPLQLRRALSRVEVFLATMAHPEPATHKYLSSDRSALAATFEPRFGYAARIPRARSTNPKSSGVRVRLKSSAPKKERTLT